jgi:hypothetical protein
MWVRSRKDALYFIPGTKKHNVVPVYSEHVKVQVFLIFTFAYSLATAHTVAVLNT